MAGLERVTLSYRIQQPVHEDGSPIVGPDGRPLFLPHFQIPAFVVFNSTVDARALGAYAFLQAFVDQSEGELSSSLTSADIARRFDVSEEVVTRAGRAKNPPGLVPRLVRAGALVVGPNTVKTRDCEACSTEMDSPCPDTCTSRKGRRRIKPRFELATDPEGGFAYPGPINRWEYYNPKKIAKRLREEEQGTNRREIVPFTQVLAWTALDRTIGLAELGVYVFIAAHTKLDDGDMGTDESLFRNSIARRFGWSEGYVSEITAKLEQLKLITKAGLVHGYGHRYGHTGEPTSYVVRVMPPAGLMHPHPIRISEYRNQDRITQRQEAVRSVRNTSLSFARVPSDLRNVDNSRCPQESTRGNLRLWTWKPEAVDVESGDLNTNPLNTPQDTPPPSVGAQPQSSPLAHGQGSSDGNERPREESEPRHRAPSAAPAESDLVALVEKHVPRGLCRNGRSDQEKLAARLSSLREYGFTQTEIEDVFAGITPETVLNPWAVVASRTASVPRLREHLAVIARRREKAAAAEVPGPQWLGRCAQHGVDYDPSRSKPGHPYCPSCEAPDRPGPDQDAPQHSPVAGEESSEEMAEEEIQQKMLDSLAEAAGVEDGGSAGPDYSASFTS